ncbi:MAG TPA: tetratricopeptide repeat protein [Candidatus Paceibacterota bacterium]|nr:tetratricopeptide repeat protein [Candidatus Paceibacterota bacterium]
MIRTSSRTEEPAVAVEVVAEEEAAPTARLASVRWERWGINGSVYEKIVQGLLYVVVFLIPLFYLPWTSSVLEYNKQLLLVVVASIGLIVWLLGVVVTGKLNTRPTPVDKGILGVLAATIVATIFSMARMKSVFGLSTSLSSSLVSVLALTILYFLAVNTLADRGRMLRRVLVASLGLSIIAGLSQVLGWFVLPGVFAKARSFTTLGTVNALGVIAAIGLPLFSKMGKPGRTWTAISVVGVILSVAVLVVLNWWVLWTIALAGILAMIAFDALNASQLSEQYGKRRNRFALSRFVVPMVVIVLGGFLLLVGFSISSVRNNLPVEIAPSYSLSWSVTKSVVQHNMLFGWGPENYSLAFDKYGAGALANSQAASLRFYDGTSELFTSAVQGGAVEILALLFLAWCVIQVTMRFGMAIGETSVRGEAAAFANEASGTLSALVATIAALVLYPFNITLLFVAFVLLALAGLIISGGRSRTMDIEERPTFSLAASLGFIIGLILVLSGVYFTTVRYLADARYAQALQATTPQAAMDGLVKAIALNNQDDRFYRDASQVALALVGQETNKPAGQTDTTKIQNMVAAAVQLAQGAVQIAPQESLNWNNLGIVYQSLSGLVDNVESLAQDAYTRAGELRPGDPTFENSIGQMWLSRADLVQTLAKGSQAATFQQQYTDALTNAATAFQKAIDMSPSYGLAIYNLGAVYDRQGKTDDAIKQLEKIAPYNTDQPTLMFELGLLYIRANRHADALTVMQRAVLLAPQYSNARWYVALLLEEKGDIAGALAQLTEIQKTNPDNQTLNDKIAQLQSGTKTIPPEKVIDTKPLQ